MDDYIDTDKATEMLRRAYAGLSTSNPWVPISTLRDAVDIVPDQITQLLTRLFLDGQIRLIAEVNRKTLTPDDRAAAVYAGGEDKHLVRWQAW